MVLKESEWHSRGGGASGGGASDARGPQRVRATTGAQRRREKAAPERERNLRWRLMREKASDVSAGEAQ